MAGANRPAAPFGRQEEEAEPFLLPAADWLPALSEHPSLYSEESFYESLSDFCVARGATPTQGLQVHGRIITSFETFHLFKTIAAEGGLDRLSELKWTAICTSLGIEPHLCEQLKESYIEQLLAFDRHVNGNPGPEPQVNSTPPAGDNTEPSSQSQSARTSREKILAKRAEIEQLVGLFCPGRSADGFFNFYSSSQSDNTMASTRSSLREGLRQAPKVNQPFIPDTAPVRQTRSGGQGPNSLQGTPTGQTPNSHSAGPDISNPSSALFNIDHFEGKDTRQVPMSTREVATPGNKPEVFAKRTRELKAPDFYDPYYPLRFLNLPNPTNIYKRVHYGLQSGIPNEVDFALFHLVNMSHQRGDKLRFEGFPQMMETLMEKALDITWLCTGVKWEFLRDHYKWPEQMHRPNVLNTLWGTNDILDRIKKIPVTLPRDTLVTYEYADELRLIKQAMLALRNMCTLPENAKFIANYSKGLLRDFLVVMFNLPYENRFNELTNDALDIAADVTKFLPTAPDDPLCISLFRFIGDEDRAHVTRGLFALTAFSKEIEEGPKDHLAMLNVDKKHLTRLLHYTLLEGDLDILELAMDFWYQFTCIPENVEYLANLVNMPIMFVKRMVVLLTFQAVKEDQETVHQEEKRAPPPSTIPKVPPELLKELMELSEPERSSKWLRCCFIEDADCEITQIALWQAYQARFVNPNENGSGVLPAAEFIKNVSTTFTNAQAQVVPVQTAGGQTTKFIIKGIRPLETALTFDGWPYLYCRWAVGNPPNQYCDRAFTLPEDLRKHVFEDHMALQPRNPPGCYVLKKADKPIHQCKWEDCTECRRPSDDTSLVAEHVGASHLPLPRKPNAKPPNLARKILQPRIVRRSSFYNTPVTSEGEPYGVAYKACLILRNIAKYTSPDGTADDVDIHHPKSRFACFITSRDTLFNKWDHNKTLRGPLTEVLLLLDECLPTLPKRHA